MLECRWEILKEWHRLGCHNIPFLFFSFSFFSKEGGHVHFKGMAKGPHSAIDVLEKAGGGVARELSSFWPLPQLGWWFFVCFFVGGREKRS